MTRRDIERRGVTERKIAEGLIFSTVLSILVPFCSDVIEFNLVNDVSE